VVTEKVAALTAVCCVKCLDWWVAARVVTCRIVEWTVDSFVPYKSPGMDGIFLVLLGGRFLVPYLVQIFRACLATGYIPAMWQQVNVVFVPKPSRNFIVNLGILDLSVAHCSYLRPWRGWKIHFLSNEILAFMPLHPNQHAYQAGRSVETALHQLVVWVEKALEQETALGVFLGIEGAF
jgi:hypothetical protein